MISETPPAVVHQTPRRYLMVLLPQSFASPQALIWVLVVPQFVLLGLNVRAGWLAWGEMGELQQKQAVFLGCAQALFILTALIAPLVLKARLVSLRACVGLGGTAIAYLWIASYWLANGLVPESLQSWILPAEDVLYYQYLLTGPVIFYALLRLSCFESRRPMALDAGLALGVAAGIPITLVLTGVFLSSFPPPVREVVEGMLRAIPEPAWWIFFILLTAVCLGAVLRMLAAAFIWLRELQPAGPLVLAGLVGLVLPIAGLLLNRGMPFPYDFQSAEVYAMAILNGLLLLVPTTGRERLDRAVWLARCVLFAFSAYFFLIFLPFLPLSLPAMVAMGSGFLILAPVGLFMVHGQLMLSGWQRECDRGSRFSPTAAMVLAFLVIPGFYALRSWNDRQVLESALAYVYRSDYEQTRFEGDPASVQRSLENLRDFKAGLRLPFLADFYTWMVFNNLVLPDAKIARVYRIFSGKELPEAKSGLMGGMFQARSRNFRWRQPVPQDAVLKEVETAVVAEGMSRRLKVKVTVENPTDRQCEFADKIAVPEGVLVSGYGLRIENHWEPGRLFERKTALWVYEKIRDVTRRDPGIVHYRSPTELAFAIFPVEAGKTRQAEIEFLYPSGQQPEIRIGARKIEVPPGESADGPVLAGTAKGAVLLWPAGEPAGYAPQKRKPYLHFILDRSLGSEGSLAGALAQVREVAARFPEAEECRITQANYEQRDLIADLTPIRSLPGPEALGGEKAWLKPKGGFLFLRACKRAILWHQEKSQDPGMAQRFPLFIALTPQGDRVVQEEDMDVFANRIPDVSGYYRFDGRQLDAWTFGSRMPITSPMAQKPVTVFRLGKVVQAIAPSEAEQWRVWEWGGGTLEVLDAHAGRFVAASGVKMLPESDAYSLGVAPWVRRERLVFQPSDSETKMEEAVQASINAGVLIPETAFIVVENSAQWKMLELKQKQKLSKGKELELEEPGVVPEPGIGWLLLFGAGLLWAGKKWKARLALGGVTTVSGKLD
jgi:hypothetical protein